MKQTSQYVLALLIGSATLNTQALKVEQPLGNYEVDRDGTNGYPALEAGKGDKKFVNQYVKPETGMFRTQFLVDQDDAAATKKAYDESTEVKKWVVKPEIVHDWSGTKYTTTHRCFGGPCKGDPALVQLETESGLESNDIQIDQLVQLNEQLSCKCHDDDKIDTKPAIWEPKKPICACPLAESNDEDQEIPVDNVYRPAAAVAPHNELYREHGHGIIPGEKALKEAGLPTTTPEEKEKLEEYKDHHQHEGIPESLQKGAKAFKQELQKDAIINNSKVPESFPPELAGPSNELPPELAAQVKRSGLVQVGENMKWDIEANMRPSATSNEDVIDYLDEPMTRFAQKRSPLNDDDKEFGNDLDAMRVVSNTGDSNLIARQEVAIRDGETVPLYSQESHQDLVSLSHIHPIAYDEEQYNTFGQDLVQWDLQDRTQAKLSNDEVLDGVAQPFNLVEHIYKQDQQAEQDQNLRAEKQYEDKKFSADYDSYEVSNRFEGTPIGSLVENGSAALKLNVHELTGAEEQVDDLNVMLQWDLNNHALRTAVNNDDVEIAVHEPLVVADLNKRENAINFSSEMDAARAENGDMSVYENASQQASHKFNINNVAGVQGSEESYNGYNLVQTNDWEMPTFGAQQSNDDIMGALTSVPIIHKGKTEETSKFINDLDQLSGAYDDKFISSQKPTSGLHVHDIAYDEQQFLQTGSQSKWDLDFALGSKASNDEILGNVIALPKVDAKTVSAEQHQAATGVDKLIHSYNLVEEKAGRFEDAQESQDLHATVAGTDVSMHMSPLQDEEMQYNGGDLANLMVAQSWVPTMEPFTSLDQPAASNNGILNDVTEEKLYAQKQVNTKQFIKDLNKLTKETDQVEQEFLREEENKKFRNKSFAQDSLMQNIHDITGTEQSYEQE